MAPGDDAIEPELQLPPPRLLKARARGRLLTWFFITLAIIAPAIMAAFAWRSQTNWEALREHGATTTGKVAEKRVRVTGKDGRPPKARFEYQVGDQKFDFWDDISDEEYAEWLLGKERPIVYLPEDPGVAYTAADLERHGAYSTAAIALLVTGAIISVIGFAGWGWIAWEYRRWRNLLINGKPVRTTSLVVDRLRYGTGGSVWKVRYEFPVDGEMRSGKSHVDAEIGMKLEAPGARATVLYDPENPKRYELYAPLAKIYEIESPQMRWDSGR